MKDKISDLVSKLQSQTHLPFWSLSNEIAIYSMAIGSRPAWGKKTKLLNFLTIIAYKMKVSDVLIFCCGLLRAISLWLKAGTIIKKNKKNSSINNKFERIFLSFKVSSEDYLYSNYIKQSQDATLKIDSVSLEGMQHFDKPQLRFILTLLIQHAFGFTSKLKLLQTEINLKAYDLLTVCALNLGTYAFYRSYWRMLKSKNTKEVAFITLDIPLYACIDENMRTVYFQHGLLSRSLLIPKVNHFYTLTHDEEKYLKKNNPDINITINRTNQNPIIHKIKNNIIMILSPNIFLEDLPVLQSFIRQDLFNNQKIIIRPTPHCSEKEKHFLLSKFPHASLDNISVPLHHLMQKYSPKLIVSGWMSTGLATALEYECLPISLYDPNVEDKWMKRIYPNDYWNTIYPIKSRILFWPRDHEKIKIAMTSQMSYEDIIKKLKTQDR